MLPIGLDEALRNMGFEPRWPKLSLWDKITLRVTGELPRKTQVKHDTHREELRARLIMLRQMAAENEKNLVKDGDTPAPSKKKATSKKKPSKG